MLISRPINYKVNFSSPANTEEGDGGRGGGEFDLRAIKNSVPDYEKVRTTKTEICLDKIYSSSSSNN